MNPSKASSTQAAKDVLLVEDNMVDAQLLKRLLRRISSSDYHVTHVRSLQDAIACSGDTMPTVIVADLNLPDSRGTDTISTLLMTYPDVPLVVVSAWEDEAISIRSVKAGAQDYLVKGHIDGPNLHRVIRYAIERKRTELELVRLAHYDQLTGLPNRTLLRERVALALGRADREKRGVATLVLDMDRFKHVNDTLGHDVGDKLLVEASHRIRASLREQDTVARLGGDEFAVILERVGETREVLPVIERILSALDSPARIEGHELKGSASVGIAMYPENGRDLSELLRAADLAMYQAKASGRNRYQFFAEAMQEEARSRLALEWALQRAIEKREFELAYQPQLCLRTGRIVGVEGLLRWWNPTRGLLSPYHFIHGLEEFGLIATVGEWVIHAACEQLRRWHDDGLDGLRASVNVSAKQFEDPGFVDKVRDALDQTNIPASCLELELTESILMKDAPVIARLLHELRRVGVRIAIDDFGTGYSSLAYLHEFPLNALKIDKTFVQSVDDGERGAAISKLILGLGRNLHLDVIAEGVETDPQLKFLRRNGCDMAQGYLFARPELSKKMTPWLRERAGLSDTHIRSRPLSAPAMLIVGDATTK